MTENTENQNNEPTEMDLLKEQAKTLGIDIRGNISPDTLKQRIKDKLEGTNNAPTPSAPNVDDSGTPKTANQQKAARRNQQRLEQTKLVRIRITCLNPMKRDLEGEIITVANAVIGTIKRFVPFGERTNDGWHVEQIIYNELKNRQFNSVTTKKGANGTLTPINRLVPEFAIEVLPQLTNDEVRRLALAQAAADGNTAD